MWDLFFLILEMFLVAEFSFTIWFTSRRYHAKLIDFILQQSRDKFIRFDGWNDF